MQSFSTSTSEKRRGPRFALVCCRKVFAAISVSHGGGGGLSSQKGTGWPVGTPAAYGQYLFYGSDLSNEVRYIGEPRAHGGFGPVTSCEAWNRDLREAHFDAVVITPEDLETALPRPRSAGRGSVAARCRPCWNRRQPSFG